MKFTTFFLMIALVQVSARGLSQKVTYSAKSVSLVTAFKALEKQTQLSVFFSPDDLRKTTPVDIELRDVPVEKALDVLLKNQPLTYSIKGNTIFIVPKKEVPNGESSNEIVAVTAIDVRGRVVNEKGEPVEGASIAIKGSKVIGVTDNAGDFSLSNVSENAVLVFSAVSIETIEVKLQGRTSINVTARTKVNELDDIVVNKGYYTEKQRYSTGSVGKITSKEIEKQPVNNPLLALQGRVAGLVVDQTSGLPGSSIKIQVRGQNTLPRTGGAKAFDNPLFIIDGVPFAPNNANVNLFTSLVSPGTNSLYNNELGGFNPFSYIDPNSIESIEVLKDADATSIYGSRGANGVILITTKKGQAGKMKVVSNVYTGQTSTTRTMDLMNTEQYVAFRKEAFRNSTAAMTTANAPDLLIFDTLRYYDWKKEFLGATATTLDASTNISGGNVNTQFSVGAGYHRETFAFAEGLSDRRFSINSSLSHRSNDKRFELGLTNIFSYGINNSVGANSILRSFALAPNYPEIKNNEDLVWSYKSFQLRDNPLQYLKQRYAMKATVLNSSVSAAYQLFKFLRLKANLGYSSLNTNEYSALPKVARNPFTTSNPTGSAAFGKSEGKSWIFEPQAESNISAGALKISALIGSTFQQRNNSSLSVSGNNYSNDALLENLSAAGSVSANGSSDIQYKYASLFARVGFILDKKYVLNLTGRRDASSRFGPNKRVGSFGSVAGAWLFSEENWFKNSVSAISFGKLKVSYGTTGSDEINDFQYSDYWGPTSPYNGAPAYTPLNLYQPNYSWAITKKLEIGTELALLQDRISMNLNWYQFRCGNQLVGYALPIQSGFNEVTRNFPAVVENKGWELSVRTKNIQNSKFQWTSAFNISTNKNSLISFPGLETSSYYNRYRVGYSTNIVRLYDQTGVDPTTGLFVFQSKNGTTSNPQINQDNNVLFSLDPKYIGGLSNSFSWSGFELDVFFQFKKQLGRNYLATLYSSGNNIGAYSGFNLPSDILNSRWQKSGDIANVQKFTIGNSQANTAASAFINSTGAYTDASFIRLKNVSLSYSLRQNMLSRIKISGAKFYVTGQNLLTITNYQGHDPETQMFYGVPPVRTLVAGIQLTF